MGKTLMIRKVEFVRYVTHPDYVYITHTTNGRKEIDPAPIKLVEKKYKAGLKVVENGVGKIKKFLSLEDVNKHIKAYKDRYYFNERTDIDLIEKYRDIEVRMTAKKFLKLVSAIFGRQGGKAKGEAKVRGSSEYYRALRYEGIAQQREAQKEE